MATTRGTRRRTPGQARAAFLAALELTGARPAPGAVYTNLSTPVEVICRREHTRFPIPNNILRGQGPCTICAGLDGDAASRAFWAEVAAQNGLRAPGARYVNCDTPVPLICGEGHSCSPRPTNVQQGRGICDTCGGHNAAAAERAFLGRLADAGAELAPDATYVDTATPVAVLCAAGHRCRPRPGNVGQGEAICGRCDTEFDRLYLLVHPGAGAVKVGIASGPPRVRRHAARGYRLVAQWTGVDHDAARSAERAVLTGWRAAGVLPVPGAPRDGRSETAPASHLGSARARLVALLGAASEAHDLPELTAASLPGDRTRDGGPADPATHGGPA